MNDEVNTPAHYNKQGIEVIEVIEAYTPNSPHLANVLKYVCRHSYKGNALQDLRKAQWYLSRKIELLEAEQATAEWEADPANADWTGIDRGVSDWTLDDAEPPTLEQALKDESWMRDTFTTEELDEIVSLKNEIGRYATMGAGPIPEKVYEIPYNPQGAHNKFCEEQEAHLPPDRIAGDDEAATRIKDAYYNFDRFEIRGYCASCDAEISATQAFVKDPNQFDEGLMFCNHQCLVSLREWQKDWTL